MSWIPIATFLRRRPTVRWSFSCKSTRDRKRASSRSSPRTMPPTAYGRTSATLRSTRNSIPDGSTRYTGRPTSRPRNPRSPRAIPSTEERSGRFGNTSNVITSPWTPSGPAPMNVMRSTNSSIESDLPTRSARSSRWMSTFVKDASDGFSVFIQFQGTEKEKELRSLSEPNRGSRRIMEQHTIGIAGVGKMGEALVRGLIVGRVVPASRILVSDAIPARAREIAAKHGVTSLDTVADLARDSDILVLAAKPKDMPALVKGIAGHVKRDALVITLAAGVRTAFVEKSLDGKGRVVRIMPNLACAVGEGATAFALGHSATEHDALVVEEIFGAIGRVTMVEEPMLDAVTGLSGSGPGFIAALAHSMIEGGVRSGLPRDVAYKLALQTMKGTAELLLIDGLEPMQLFRMVATPNGTTEAGWAVMEKRGVPPAISDAIIAASKRAAELAAGGAKALG